MQGEAAGEDGQRDEEDAGEARQKPAAKMDRAGIGGNLHLVDSVPG